jgi:hypothetical protein
MTSFLKDRRSLALSLCALTVALAGCAAILDDPPVWTGIEDGSAPTEAGLDGTMSEGGGQQDGTSNGDDSTASDAGDAGGGGCTPGQRTCAGNTVVVCSANGGWDGGVDTCLNSACVDGGCIGTCTPTTTKCATGASYSICSSQGDWGDASVSCDAGQCLNGACFGSCSLGQSACQSDTTVVACSAAGSYDGGLTTCDASACVNGACTGTCSPGSTTCDNGNNVITCSTNGGWDGGTTNCTLSQKTCLGGACSGSCYPGETRCATSPVALQTCTTGGAWNAGTSCFVPSKGIAACAADAGCSSTGSCSDASFPDYCSSSKACVNTKNDTNNCGVCGHTCGLGNACTGGYCPPASSCTTAPNPTGLTLMSASPYITNGSTLYACNSGGAVTYTDPNGSLGSIQANVTNGTIIGITDTPTCHLVCLNSYSLTLVSGGTFTTITPANDAGTWELGAIGVDPNYGRVFYGYTTGIRFVNASSGGLPTSAEPPYVCASFPDGGAPGTVAVDTSTYNGQEWVSWWDTAANTISSAEVSSSGTSCGAPVTNATGVTQVASMVTDGMYVAWGDGAGDVYACGVGTTCGSTPTTVATGQGPMSNLAFDQGHNVYWAGMNGLVGCAATGCGGAPAVLEPASVVSSVDPVACSGSEVYWVDYNTGTLYSVRDLQ